MSLKYQPASEPLHISANQVTVRGQGSSSLLQLPATFGSGLCVEVDRLGLGVHCVGLRVYNSESENKA